MLHEQEGRSCRLGVHVSRCFCAMQPEVEDEGRRPSLEVERDFRLASLRRVKSEAA
jgi:hypothetical protein